MALDVDACSFLRFSIPSFSFWADGDQEACMNGTHIKCIDGVLETVSTAFAYKLDGKGPSLSA